jgi:hypothetical protein
MLFATKKISIFESIIMEEKRIKFRRIRERKKANPKRGVLFVVLLIIMVYLFMNAESILSKILP